MDEIKEHDSKGCRDNKFIAALLTVAWGIRHANKTGWDDINDICYYYDKAKDHLDEKDRKERIGKAHEYMMRNRENGD